MSDIKNEVYECLLQLQWILHRRQLHNFGSRRTSRNPRRGQGRILAILKMKQEISQKELTYLLDMSKQSVAEILAKLERSGFIVREPSEKDRRVSVVKLTAEGAAAADNLSDEPEDMTGLLDCLSDEELQTFHQYLKRILKESENHTGDADTLAQRRKAKEAFMREHRRHFDGRRPFTADEEIGYGDWSVFDFGMGFDGEGYEKKDDE